MGEGPHIYMVIRVAIGEPFVIRRPCPSSSRTIYLSELYQSSDIISGSE
jgi:hypothetical protein